MWQLWGFESLFFALFHLSQKSPGLRVSCSHLVSCLWKNSAVSSKSKTQSNALTHFTVELRQHTPEFNLTKAAKTSEANLFFSSIRKTVTADSLIRLRVPVWMDNKCEVRGNHRWPPCDKRTDASWAAVVFIIHGFLHCFCMTGLNAWIISLCSRELQPRRKNKKESGCSRERRFVTYETVQSDRGRRRRGIEFLRCDYLKRTLRPFLISLSPPLYPYTHARVCVCDMCIQQQRPMIVNCISWT